MAQVSVPQPPRLVDAALEYVARGIPVFPLIPHDKKPVIPKTEGGEGFKDATLDPAIVRKWWQRWPRANIGIPTGDAFTRTDGETRPASNWFVVDIDTKHGATYDDLAALGKVPPTMTAQTPSGGLHLVFRYPRGVRIGIDNVGKIARGIDIRAYGGYIAAAPSSTASGCYEWTNDLEPAPLPTWLIKKLTEQPEPMPIRKLPAASLEPSDDRDAYWLEWATAQTQPGTSDATGLKLAMQLLLDPGVRDIDGTLQRYATLASFDDRDPFDERDIDRWLKSAQASNIVRRGEPAKNPRAKKPRSRAKPAAENGAENITNNSHGPDAEGTSTLGPDVTDEMLLKGEADDNGNAEAMYRLFGHEYLFTPAYGWLTWTGTHWRDVPEAIVAQSAITTLKRRRHAAVDARDEALIKAAKASAQNIFGCLKLFKSYVIEPSVSVFDADPDTLNCLNGVFHMPTGKMTPHSPKQRYTYCLPVEHDSTADDKPWREFVLDGLGRDESAAEYLQMCVGYSLTGHTREEKMFYLFGPPRAGKGTVTETLLDLLPRPLSTEADFSSFTAQRDNDSQNFDLAELKPARIVIASESNKYQSLNPAKIKTLTGGNHIRCAFKHKDMFTYRPQFKVWLVSNHKVTADADDEALWGRVQVFTFPHSHLGSEDTTLKDRMKSKSNLQGVLRWALEGAMKWYEQGRLVPPDSVVEATREHRDKQDYVKQWIGDSCTLTEHAWTTSAALTASYQTWCESSGVKPLRPSDFAETLVKRFGCEAKRQAGTGARGYKGIAMGVTPVTDED